LGRAKTRKEPLMLSYEEKGRQIVVTPEDNDRFVTTVEHAIAACQMQQESEEFAKQFDRLLRRLAGWIVEQQDKIKEAYLTVRDAGLLFLVVRKEKHYDRELTDSLTDLDIEIAQSSEFNLVRLSVLALPNASKDSVYSFILPGLSLVYRHAE